MTRRQARAIPAIDELTVAARHRNSGPGDVGGDWYDLLDLPGGGVAAVVGDVAGRGFTAATTMGQLRHAARASVLDTGDPAEVLTRMNRLAHRLLPGEIATAVIAVFPPGGSPVQLSAAGHLPPLLLHDRQGTFLDVPSGPALGVKHDANYVSASFGMGAGAMLVLYTDGLVERRGESIDDGLERLRSAAVAHGPVDALCDLLLAAIPEGPGDDDLAVVTLRRAGTT